MEDLKLLYTIAASIFISIFIYFLNHLVLQNRRKQPLPPSPWSLPVIGHLHLLKNPLQKSFQSLSAQYGPVLGLKLGNQYTVVVSSPAAVESCFGKNDLVLADRPQTHSWKDITYDFTTMVSANYGEHWRNVRQISNQELFSTSRQNMFMSLRKDEVKLMIKSLFCLTAQEKQKVEMKSKIGNLMFNIIVRTVTGKRYYGEGVEDSAEAKEFRKIIQMYFELTAATNAGDLLPLLKLIDFGDFKKKMIKLKKDLDGILQNLIDKSKRKGGGVAQSMLENMLSSQELISDKTIKGLMMMMITAGVDTTAATIEWGMSLLLNNPEKLKKARSELDAMISPGSRLVEEADLAKLTYIQSIVNETLRLYPSVPVLLPHYSSGECTIEGFHVPRGTMIFANAWAIHRDPKVWEDPLSFKPERFENVEGSLVYKFIPFGSGRRSCPGASMAQKIVGLALASLIQCFDWELAGEDEVDMQEGDGLIMPKLKPLEAMCQPRNSTMDVLSSL